jgi:outer membrane receptor protein involved in Fe transport
MVFQRKKVASALGYVFGVGGAALLGTSAQAQDVRVDVTGTRLPSPNLESTSPIAVISSRDIKLEGVTSVENLLNNMPQVFADYGGFLANGATGTATVNLRNLGADRTLVLINGRRLPAGSPTFYATDLNQIPAALIQRVEVLTGGASAVYGSDAIAGVVNFIMKDNFQGIQAEINYSGYNHQQDSFVGDIVAGRAATNPSQYAVPGDASFDGEIQEYNLTIGSNFADNRGNATVFFSYMRQKALLQGERDFSACALASNATGFVCQGSGTSFPGQFVNLGTGQAFTVADAQGNPRPFVAATDQFNFAPYNHYQRPDERYGFAAFAHFNITPHHRVFGEFLFHDDRTNAQIAPSGVFGEIVPLTAANPLLTPAMANALVADDGTLILRRNIEGGGRQDDRRHTSFRSVIGLKGDLFQFWDYNVFWQTGKVVYQSRYLNDFSKTRIQRALNVVTDPATGQPTCASVLDGTDPLCVPYDIFRLGGVTDAAINYLQTPGLQNGETGQEVLGASIAADLGNYNIRTPWAKEGIGVAFGVERREEKLELTTDTAFSTFDLAGQGGPTIGLSGAYTVKEIYGEVRVPILQGLPFADLLSMNASYRYSDYNTGISTDSYGIGVEWAPVKQVRLRGSYQQAVRAPNIIDLFTAQGFNLFNNDEDPCAGTTPSATFEQCARQGVTAAQYGTILDNPAGQYNYLQGGNPQLDAEKAKSYTVGAVFTPTRNFNASIDYFNIKVDNVIDNLEPAFILQQCIEAALFCNLINRDSLGTIWLDGFITATQQNLAQLKTAGVDITANYTHDLASWGGLNFNFVGTWLEEFKRTNVPGLGEYDCAGLYGAVCGTPLPEWRHKLRVGWSTPWQGLELALTWRYFDSVKIDASSSNPLLAGAFNPVDAQLGDRNYIDLAASWSPIKYVTLFGGINNVFDKDPPIVSSTIAGPPYGSGNTYPQVYDTLGRKIFITLQVKY